jgi:hypothetical protein
MFRFSELTLTTETSSFLQIAVHCQSVIISKKLPSLRWYTDRPGWTLERSEKVQTTKECFSEGIQDQCLLATATIRGH